MFHIRKNFLILGQSIYILDFSIIIPIILSLLQNWSNKYFILNTMKYLF